MNVNSNSLEMVAPGLGAVAAAALLHEAMGRRGALNPEIKAVYSGAKLAGRALTVRCAPGDNLMLHVAVSLAKPGDVLVAAMEGFVEAGCWGELASLAAQVRGIRGLVLDGAVRDVEAIAEMGFPVFARGLCIKGTTKRQKGEVNVTIVVGGVSVCPGDLVVGDADGVVVVPAAEAQEVIAAARALQAKEEAIKERLKAGETTLDLLDLRPMLRDLGLDGLTSPPLGANDVSPSRAVLSAANGLRPQR
jgi:4-hydroxy-4-methyl-2-oxoglutarate aldolase